MVKIIWKFGTTAPGTKAIYLFPLLTLYVRACVKSCHVRKLYDMRVTNFNLLAKLVQFCTKSFLNVESIHAVRFKDRRLYDLRYMCGC